MIGCSLHKDKTNNHYFGRMVIYNLFSPCTLEHTYSSHTPQESAEVDALQATGSRNGGHDLVSGGETSDPRQFHPTSVATKAAERTSTDDWANDLTTKVVTSPPCKDQLNLQYCL